MHLGLPTRIVRFGGFAGTTFYVSNCTPKGALTGLSQSVARIHAAP